MKPPNTNTSWRNDREEKGSRDPPAAAPGNPNTSLKRARDGCITILSGRQSEEHITRDTDFSPSLISGRTKGSGHVNEGLASQRDFSNGASVL